MLSNMLDPFQVNFKQIPILLDFLDYALTKSLKEGEKRDIVAICWVGYAENGLDVEFLEYFPGCGYGESRVFVSYEDLERLWREYAKASTFARKVIGGKR